MKKLTEIGGHARQGDVLLRHIEKVPSKAKKINKVVLAFGEVTGHSHTVDGATCFADDESAETAEYLQTDVERVVTHQEHSPIMLPKKSAFERLYQVEDTSREVTRVAD